VAVRDKRRLPFVMITKAALVAIREELSGRRGQTALAVYVAVVEAGNDARSETFETPRRKVAERAMVHPDVLKDYVRVLERLGLVEVLDQSALGKPMLWTLTDPPAAEGVGAASPPGVDAASQGGRGAESPPSKTGGVDAAPGGGVDAAPTPLKEEGVKKERRRRVSSPKGEETSPLNEPTASLRSRRELVELSERLAAGIKQRHSKADVKPASKGWLDPLRKMIDLDGYTVDEVDQLITFVLTDEFNSQTVLSPRKLRERRDELAIKAGVAQPADDGLFKFRSQRPKVNRLTQPVDEAALPAVTPELRAAWAPIMAQLERVVDEPTRKLWLDGLHLHAAGDELVIGCGHGATRWVNERFGKVITAAAEPVVGADVPVRIVECGCAVEERAA